MTFIQFSQSIMSKEKTPLVIGIIFVQIFSSKFFCQSLILPEQIHLSFGKCPNDMVVTWVTFDDTKNSYVWYGAAEDGISCITEGSSTKFVDGGKKRTVRYIHRVALTGLEPNNLYVYRCGSERGVSEAFLFKTPPNGTEWSPRLIVFGDMGVKGANAFPYIVKERNEKRVDAIFHIGDIAYNMDSLDGKVGDEFLRMIQPVASSIPYMTTVGNHEQAYNFSHYKNKFTMPGDSQNMFYSFDLGPAHFVAISTEVYYFPEYGYESIATQYHWLRDDLQKAAKPENRARRPWIIALGHRPMYCSSDTQEDCSFPNNILKCCTIDSCPYGLEGLFHKHRVDLFFAGHMHYYERSWPIYDNKVYNGSLNEPYRNPGALVHIISGAGGMKSGTESASHIRPDYFPFYSKDYSYTVLTIHNRTHIHLEQISANRHGQVMDAIWLVKDKACCP